MMNFQYNHSISSTHTSLTTPLLEGTSPLSTRFVSEFSDPCYYHDVYRVAPT